MTDEPQGQGPASPRSTAPREPRTPGAPRSGGGPPASQFAGLGLQLAAVVAVFTYGGYWLDRRLGTTPWLTILLVFVGAGGALHSIYRKVFPVSSTKSDDARRPRR